MRQALLALTATLVLSALVPTAHAATGLGIPANTPTLFALNADRGTLTPTARKNQFVLTLSKLDRRGVWFTDKPARKSGTVRPAVLFSSWKTLGFVQDRPNAVVTLPGGRDGANTVAFELGTPRYSARTGTVRFTVSTLSSLSAGLAHHGPNLDDGIPRRFGEAALFIDDGQDDGAIGAGGDCYVGGIVLVATTRMLSGVAAADGSTPLDVTERGAVQRHRHDLRRCAGGHLPASEPHGTGRHDLRRLPLRRVPAGRQRRAGPGVLDRRARALRRAAGIQLDRTGGHRLPRARPGVVPVRKRKHRREPGRLHDGPTHAIRRNRTVRGVHAR